VWLGGLLLVAGLTGCGAPLEAYRSMTGLDKNDPDPDTAPFTANLDKAETQSYPNLASVPLPPEIASTLAERQKLTADLSGARTSVQSNGGTATPGPVPPPPAIPSSIAVPAMASLGPPVAPPRTPLPPLRPMDEPPAPMSPTTTMQVPAITNVPGVEASRSSPAAGQPSAMPRPAPSTLPAATQQSGSPQPSPPVASLPPAQVTPQVAAMPPPKLPPVPITVASLDVAPGAAALPAGMQSRLADVVSQYKEKPRTVRVVSYAAPAVGGAEQLNSFRAALDRAQIVAKELSDAGIPASKIQTEAAPSEANTPTGRIEVQLLP
jgi:hypothetical protein